MRGVLCEEFAYSVIETHAEDPGAASNIGAQANVVALVESSIEDTMVRLPLLTRIALFPNLLCTVSIGMTFSRLLIYANLMLVHST